MESVPGKIFHNFHPLVIDSRVAYSQFGKLFLIVNLKLMTCLYILAKNKICDFSSVLIQDVLTIFLKALKASLGLILLFHSQVFENTQVLMCNNKVT